jgi:uncharacterized protein
LFGKKETLTKLLFATDIHGSEKCWQKLVNAGAFFEVETIILGGDITGKGIQALLEETTGTWHTNFLGQEVAASDAESLAKLETRVRTAGFYPYRIRPDEYQEFSASEAYRERIFTQLVTQSMQGWVELAERKLKGSGRRIIVTAGNDDPFFINALFEQSSVIVYAERRIIQIDENHEMLNEGFSNPTPWHTHREISEEEMLAELTKQAEQIKDVRNAVFNIHVPPFNSKLDDAPLLDENLVPVDGGRTYVPVGSKAVRQVIETFQPLLGLHGHIHEAKGQAQIGRTVCLNPGSTYGEGVLSGYLITLDKKSVRGFQPVQG